MIPRAIHHRRKRLAPGSLPPSVEKEDRCPQSRHYETLFNQNIERRDSEASSTADFFFASLDEEPAIQQQQLNHHSLSLSPSEARHCLTELNAVIGLPNLPVGGEKNLQNQFTRSAPDLTSTVADGSVPRRTQSLHHDLQHPLKSSLRSSLKSLTSQITTMKPNNTVSFSKLDIREYDIAISDHPSCSCGPPIQLGWSYNEQKDLKLEEYETIRSSSRSREDMLLSYHTRNYLLREYAGCSREEIENSIKEVERVKRDRLITDMLMPANLLNERIDDAVSHVSSLFGVRR